MSEKIDTASAIAALEDMFPNFDEDVILMVLSESGNMDKAISSLLIMSGDESPELVRSLQHQFVFHPSEATERELHELERDYGLNFHKAWITRLPDDLLVMRLRRVSPEAESHPTGEMVHLERGNAALYMRPEDVYLGPSPFTLLAKDLKEKWSNYRLKRKGYQLTKTTEE